MNGQLTQTTVLMGHVYVVGGVGVLHSVGRHAASVQALLLQEVAAELVIAEVHGRRLAVRIEVRKADVSGHAVGQSSNVRVFGDLDLAFLSNPHDFLGLQIEVRILVEREDVRFGQARLKFRVAQIVFLFVSCVQNFVGFACCFVCQIAVHFCHLFLRLQRSNSLLAQQQFVVASHSDELLVMPEEVSQPLSDAVCTGHDVFLVESFAILLMTMNLFLRLVRRRILHHVGMGSCTRLMLSCLSFLPL
jgi:hypothetical protein